MSAYIRSSVIALLRYVVTQHIAVLVADELARPVRDLTHPIGDPAREHGAQSALDTQTLEERPAGLHRLGTEHVPGLPIERTADELDVMILVRQWGSPPPR